MKLSLHVQLICLDFTVISVRVDAKYLAQQLQYINQYNVGVSPGKRTDAL